MTNGIKVQESALLDSPREFQLPQLPYDFDALEPVIGACVIAPPFSTMPDGLGQLRLMTTASQQAAAGWLS